MSNSNNNNENVPIPIRIHWKPYVIDPKTKGEGEEYLAYNRRRWGSDGWTQHLRREGRQVGANFSNWKWWPNTFKAHQLVCFFEHRQKHQRERNAPDNVDRTGETDITSLCNEAMFQALYEEGYNLSDVEILTEKVAGEKLGLSSPAEKQALKNYLLEDVGAAQVQLDIQEGRQQYNIKGVPFFVIGVQHQKAVGDTNLENGSTPYAFSGAQSIETFLEIFDELNKQL